MNLQIYFILGILISAIFALLEIQIEGKNGWAGQLPTWKIYRSWFKYIPGGNKELTGYHLYLWIFIFLMLHFSIVFVPFSIKTELSILSFYLFVLRLEDFLWFVFNPNYGLRKFNKANIPWHSSWFLGLPVQYYYSIILWGVLFYFACSIS